MFGIAGPAVNFILAAGLGVASLVISFELLRLLAAVNLALALEDTKGEAAAATEYERALSLDEDFADAHFNLAGLYEKLGRGADALRHYRAYQQLTSRGE